MPELTRPQKITFGEMRSNVAGRPPFPQDAPSFAPELGPFHAAFR